MTKAEKQMCRKRKFRRIIHTHLKRIQRMHKSGDLGYFGEVPSSVAQYRKMLSC